MDDTVTVTCDGCGNEYPLALDPDAEDEGPEHHEADCPIRQRKIEVGEWEDPDA